MPDWLALPPARRLGGRIAVPPSKSASNRALAVAALSPAPCEIRRLLESEDIAAMRRCLEAMGAKFDEVDGSLRVRGPLGIVPAVVRELDAGESGTAARFLAALAAAVPGRYRLAGSGRLTERPMAGLVRALRAGGAQVESESGEDRLPLRIEGATLRSGDIRVDASGSSQFFSALLLAGAAIPGGLRVEPEGDVASAPYIRLTIETLRLFGHTVEEEDRAVRVIPGPGESPARYDVPGDYSSAIPMLAACGIAGGHIELEMLEWPSADPDAAAVPVLERMGLEIRASRAVIRARRAEITPAAVRVRATDFPDAVPSLAALAAFARAESRFEGIAHLKEKESDRIDALARLLAAAGVDAVAEPDALRVAGISGEPPSGVKRLPTFGDHRIAMAAGLLALRIPGVLIENPGCVAKSYPGFFRDLETIVVR